MCDVCASDILAQPVWLGGQGHIVAIDESIVARRKPGNVQGCPVPAQWVFRGWTWPPVISSCSWCHGEMRLHCCPSSTYSQEPVSGATNGRLNQHGFIHETVNHTQHYVNPVTGVHTNNIEAWWAACKATFKWRNGVTCSQIPSYIVEYMWRSKHLWLHTFTDILAAIRARYPVWFGTGCTVEPLLKSSIVLPRTCIVLLFISLFSRVWSLPYMLCVCSRMWSLSKASLVCEK